MTTDGKNNEKRSSVVSVPDDISLFQVFDEDHDRFAFPGPVYRVTGGHGGEAILIAGSQRTALIDCGMAYCGETTVGNIIRRLSALGRDRLDCVFLSHSHYDHIGALPDIRKAFPKAEVYGSAHCAKILERPGAHSLMKELGQNALELYDPASDKEITTEGLKVDHVLSDGDSVPLGNETVRAFETKGHTDCSMSYLLEPESILFTSESTGIIESREYVHTPCLKSFVQGLASMEKCRSLNPKHICLPHFGLIPQDFNQRYWDMFRAECHAKASYVAEMKARGMGEEEMLANYTDKYWTEAKAMEQPKEAFLINSRHILGVLLKELDELNSQEKRNGF